MKINHRVRCKTMRRLFRFFSRSARIKHFGNVNDEISSLQLQLWPFIEHLTIKDRQFLLEVQTIQTREPPILKKAPNDKSVDEVDEHTSQLMSYRDKLLSLIDKYTHANNLTKKEFKREYTPSISMPSLYLLKQPDDHSTKTSTKKNINPKGNIQRIKLHSHRDLNQINLQGIGLSQIKEVSSEQQKADNAQPLNMTHLEDKIQKTIDKSLVPEGKEEIEKKLRIAEQRANQIKTIMQTLQKQKQP